MDASLIGKIVIVYVILLLSYAGYLSENDKKEIGIFGFIILTPIFAAIILFLLGIVVGIGVNIFR